MDCRSNRLHDIAGEHLAAPISMDDDISKLGRLLKAGDRCTRVGEPALAIVPQRGLESAGANDAAPLAFAQQSPHSGPTKPWQDFLDTALVATARFDVLDNRTLVGKAQISKAAKPASQHAPSSGNP